MPTGIIPNTDIELNLLSGAHWSRTTIADGKWLNSNTIQPLFNNDCILASAIHDTSADLYNRLSAASGELQDEIDDINYEIDVINAGSDVIDVVGSWAALQSYEGWTTDNDVIKVLNDEHSANNQTYYRYVDDTLTSGTMNPDPSKWQYVGDLAPYYSKTEIDGKITDINNTINNVSSTLHREISDTSAILHQEILTSANIVHNELVTTSGNIINVITNVSGDIIDYVDIASGNLVNYVDNTSAYLIQQIESTSSYLNTYIETASGNLHQDIYNTSSYLLGELETSALNLQNDIDYVSGQADYSAAYLYSLIHDTSGKTEVSGGRYVEVKKSTKPDGMVSYSADLYENQMVNLDSSGEHLKIVNSGNTSTFVCDASQILAAPDGVTVPIDLLIRQDRSGYDVTGSGVSGFIPSIPPKTSTGLERLVLGKDGSDPGSNFGWVESDLISKTLRDTYGIVNSSARQHELDFEILTYRNVPVNPLQVKVHSFDEAGNETIYGELIPPTSGANGLIKEKSIRINNESRVEFTEDPINYLEHTTYQGDIRYHNVHLCGYWGDATEERYGFDKSVRGDAFGVSADHAFRDYHQWMVWPMNNNDETSGINFTGRGDGILVYENKVQSFTQDGSRYYWRRGLPIILEANGRNTDSNGRGICKLVELPKDPHNKYPKYVHGSAMVKTTSGHVHVIPTNLIYHGSEYDTVRIMDENQNYNITNFVPNVWNHISFDFTRTKYTENWGSEESDLRYVAIKGNSTTEQQVTVENLRLLCWY